MRMMAILLFCLLTAPVQLSVRAGTNERTRVRGALTLTIYGIGGTIRFHIEKEKDRFFLRVANRPRGKPLHLQKKRSSLLTSSLKRQLSFWRRHCLVYIKAQIGLADAAHTALLCASLSALLSVLPYVRSQVTPHYHAVGYAVQIRGIANFRLGKLFLAAVMLIAARLMQTFSGGAQHGDQ